MKKYFNQSMGQSNSSFDLTLFELKITYFYNNELLLYLYLKEWIYLSIYIAVALYANASEIGQMALTSQQRILNQTED